MALAELDLEIWAPMGVDDELRAMFLENAEASNTRDPAEDVPSVGRLGEIGVPTLVITAGQDLPAVNELGALLAREIPGGRRTVIEEADHMISGGRRRSSLRASSVSSPERLVVSIRMALAGMPRAPIGIRSTAAIARTKTVNPLMLPRFLVRAGARSSSGIGHSVLVGAAYGAFPGSSGCGNEIGGGGSSQR